jgi:DNA-binding response OmpR family regulator
MHVSKVRKKLGDTDNDEHIKTIRGVGYIFARPRENAGEKAKVKSTS